MPHLIKGDLDSLRPDTQAYYFSKVSQSLKMRGHCDTHPMYQSVPIIQDKDEYSTDLMKCIESLAEKETLLGIKVC